MSNYIEKKEDCGLKQQADAWLMVADTLTKCLGSKWLLEPYTGMECARHAIRELAIKAKLAQPSDDDGTN